MADLLSSVSPIAMPAIASPPGAPPGAPSLAAFVELMAGQAAAAAPTTTAMPVEGESDRQEDAAPGALLPGGDGRDDVDPALAWLLAGRTPVASPTAPVMMPVITAAVISLPPPLSTTGAQATMPVLSAIPAPLAIGAQEDAAAASSSTSTTKIDPGVVGLTTLSPLAGREGSGMGRPVRDDTLVANAALGRPVVLKNGEAISSRQPTPDPSLPGRGIALASLAAVDAPPVLPARFALAAAGDRAAGHDDRPDAPTFHAIVPTPTDAIAIAPTADAPRQTLDMGRHDWPQRMIGHIETLRDDANARDTAIRLKPEALGRVDVALRTHDDGAVSVRFTAAQPATRALIADAAPQLREAAEARGIRLAQTSVDLSQHGHDRRARSDAAPPAPAANRLADTTGDDTDAVADGRIA